jgi:hypothetical protein
VVSRAAKSLAGARGKIFLGALISKIFPEKNFFRQQPSPPQTIIALQRLYLNFSYQISLLCPKNKYLALCAEIFLPKK